MARTYRLISGDSHLQIPPDRWTHRVPEKYRDLAPRRIRLPQGGDGVLGVGGDLVWGGTGSFAGHTPENFNPMVPIEYDEAVGSGGPEQRVREQDADGIEAELIYSGTPTGLRFIQKLPDHNAHLAINRAYNDFLGEEYCAYAPDRLFGTGVLPSGTIDEKIAEMEHCKRIGLKAIHLTSYPSEKPYPMPEDDRFWAAAIDLEMPITIHTAIAHHTGEGGAPLFNYPVKPQGPLAPDDFMAHLSRYYGWSRSGGVDAVQMVVAGLFARFPTLHIYWGENAIGWVPFMYEQMDIEYEKNSHWAERLYGLPRLERSPSEYLREHAYWGFYEDRVGIELRHWLGVDRIIWGGDFPHYPTRWPESRSSLARQLQGVPAEERTKMLAQNLIDFLHLDAIAEPTEL
jgi:predicted TIM-barrel fold metal-dependent hydrolase